MAYPPIYVIRHGETEWNALGRLQGRLDSPLTGRGMMQAARVGEILGHHAAAIGLPIGGRLGTGTRAQVFASPQGRALASAQIALEGQRIAIATDPRLAEIDVGDWTGLTRPEMIAQRPDLFPGTCSVDDPLGWYDRAPAGEGIARLALRCVAFLDELRDPAVLFTHGITSRVLRCLALGLPAQDFSRLEGGQGTINWVRDGISGSFA